jgi:hypothetical protein
MQFNDYNKYRKYFSFHFFFYENIIKIKKNSDEEQREILSPLSLHVRRRILTH